MFNKIPNGEVYYFNRHGNTIQIIKAKGDMAGCILNTGVPRDMVGKRVRVKLELVEDDDVDKIQRSKEE